MAARFVLKPGAVKRQLLRNPATLAAVAEGAKKMADAAGDGFESDSANAPGRARAIVYASTHEAVVAESENMALTRAIDAARR